MLLGFLSWLNLCISQSAYAGPTLRANNQLALIDFESLPGTTPSEGLQISTQYQVAYGITFSLEGGGHPVLAKVGGTSTAFDSAFGPDTTAPGQDVGTYFLTDDGVLSGLQSPALIVNYDTPTAAASGVILIKTHDYLIGCLSFS